METNRYEATGAAPDDHSDPPSTPRPVSTLHRFVPYRGDAVDAETVVSGCTLIGLLGFACLLFGQCFDAGLVA